MNDEKMDTFDSNPQNATGSDPLSQTDAPIASQKAESELAISDEEQDTTSSLAFCESPVEADALSADPDPHSDLDPSPDPSVLILSHVLSHPSRIVLYHVLYLRRHSRARLVGRAVDE